MNKLVKFWYEARKTVSALAIDLLGWGSMVVESDSASITSTEWIGLGTAVLVALGVWTFANKPAPPPA